MKFKHFEQIQQSFFVYKAIRRLFYPHFLADIHKFKLLNLSAKTGVLEEILIFGFIMKKTGYFTLKLHLHRREWIYPFRGFSGISGL